MNVVDIKTGKTIAPPALTPKDQLEALVLAKMNQERAELCQSSQPGVAALLYMNSKFLLDIAQRGQ